MQAIPLSSITSIQAYSLPVDPPTPHAFEIVTPDRTYFASAESQEVLN